MFENPIVQDNLKKLEHYGYEVIQPAVGLLACKDVGKGKMPEIDQEAAEKFLKAVEALVNELDTPTLEQFGINKEEFFNVIDKMAHDAMDSGSPQNTMRDVTEEEVKEIYRKLW